MKNPSDDDIKHWSYTDGIMLHDTRLAIYINNMQCAILPYERLHVTCRAILLIVVNVDDTSCWLCEDMKEKKGSSHSLLLVITGRWRVHYDRKVCLYVTSGWQVLTLNKQLMVAWLQQLQRMIPHTSKVEAMHSLRRNGH